MTIFKWEENKGGISVWSWTEFEVLRETERMMKNYQLNANANNMFSYSVIHACLQILRQTINFSSIFDLYKICLCCVRD